MLANLRNLALAEFRAATDSLTGLPNSRAARDTLKRMVAQAARMVSPLSALLLDLDHFKQINDTLGHGRGDDVLAAVGSVLPSVLREADFVARYGGEEFLILLPATGHDEAAIVAEKVRAAIETITVAGINRAITASIGIAAVPEDAGDADTHHAARRPRPLYREGQWPQPGQGHRTTPDRGRRLLSTLRTARSQAVLS